MSFPKQVTVPDTSADMSVPAKQLSAEAGSIPERTTFMVNDGTTVYMMIAPAPNALVEPEVFAPTAQAVVDGGMPLFPQKEIVLVGDYVAPEIPNPARLWFATKSGDGAGDVRIMSGVL